MKYSYFVDQISRLQDFESTISLNFTLFKKLEGFIKLQKINEQIHKTLISKRLCFFLG